MTPLTEAVSQKIDALFAVGDRATARMLIEEKCGADIPLYTHGTDLAQFDRVRFAVLKLSNGNLLHLIREIKGARLDWRDTLMAAGFGEDIHAHLLWNPKPTQ